MIDAEWWEWDDEFPHHSVNPEKQALSESLDTIALEEPYNLFAAEDGTYIAVGRRYGAIYKYDGGTWIAQND